MTDTTNPFAGLANIANEELAEVVTPPRHSRVIDEGDVPVQFSVRVKKRLRTKARQDAQARGLSVQDYLERLLSQGLVE